MKVVEERQLLDEEQGGFRRERGCRDQNLTLALLGQTMKTRGKERDVCCISWVYHMNHMIG